MEGRGGRFLWSGRVTAQVVGSGGESFEIVGLVECSAGLQGQWLLATSAESMT